MLLIKFCFFRPHLLLAIVVWTKRKRNATEASLTPLAPKGTPLSSKVLKLSGDNIKKSSVTAPLKPTLLAPELKDRSYTPPPQVKRTHTPPGSPRYLLGNNTVLSNILTPKQMICLLLQFISQSQYSSTW